MEQKNELTSEQFKKVKMLILRECCNCDEKGNCSVLDDGEYHKCPQLTERELTCSWFCDAVLPLNPVLEVEICAPGTIEVKKCEACGKEIVRGSNRAKYCKKCAAKIHRKQRTESQRKIRTCVDK